MGLYRYMERHRWVRIAVGTVAILSVLYCAIYTLVISVLVLSGAARIVFTG